MAHCPIDLLDDVADIVAEVRRWAEVIEKKPVVFYLRREPFFHFHLLQGSRRRADIKSRSGWIQVDLSEPMRAATRQRLLRDLRRCYRERCGAAPR